MANIQDYIDWRGDLSLDLSEFNRIDALILCQISYLNFDGLLNDGDFESRISIEDLCREFNNSPDYKKRADTGLLINSKTADFFTSVASSVRFKDVLVTGYRSIIDESKEEQFAAMSYILPDKTNFVCYRGTDDTIVGWKEDFNLALYEVPAQKDAILYLEEAAKKLKGELRIGGHSKGGNLAIYSSFMAPASIKKRIVKIYNNDGPGFSEEKINSPEYKEIVDKINSYYPQYSIVGMLFSNEGKFRVVESDEIGVMQHDPFSWHLKGTSFETVKKLSGYSKFLHETFNSWVKKLDKAQTEKFINSLFGILEATDAKTNSEIESNLVVSSVKIIKYLNELDQEQRSMMIEVLKELIKTGHSKLPRIDKIIKTSLEDTKAGRDKALKKVEKTLKLDKAKEKLIETKDEITAKAKKALK